MKNLYLTTLFLSLVISVNAQQTIAICKEKYGCDIAKVNISRTEIDKILGKPNFLTAASKNSLLVLNNCSSTIDGKRTIQQLHIAFGGKGVPKAINQFDLKQYIIDKGCISKCLNSTKKISFKISSSEFSGSSYSFINLKKGEAFMPNAAFQQLYNGQGELANMVVDSYFRNYKYITYVINPEVGKVKMDVNIGLSIGGFKNDKLNLAKWKRDFKLTGNKRKHLNTNDLQFEYVGIGDEGEKITFWLVESKDACLPQGKFDAMGFWGLGYISFDGRTYLVTELAGSDFKVTITNIIDGNYNFNPVGYKSMGSFN